MKKRIFLLAIHLLIFSNIFAQLANIVNAQTITWDYPVKPGSDEWAALSSHNEMLKVCQLPAEILNTIPTKELAEICLNYPLKVDFYAYNNLHEGLTKVAAKFNGLQELFNRKDNAQYLLILLQNNNLEELINKDIPILQKGGLTVKQSLIEVLLSHKLVLNNTNFEQQKAIADIAMQNMMQKGQQPRLYSRYSLEASAYLLCAILKTINNNVNFSSELELFLEHGTLTNNVQIEELKQNYYKTLMK